MTITSMLPLVAGLGPLQLLRLPDVGWLQPSLRCGSDCSRVTWLTWQGSAASAW